MTKKVWAVQKAIKFLVFDLQKEAFCLKNGKKACKNKQRSEYDLNESTVSISISSLDQNTPNQNNL